MGGLALFYLFGGSLRSYFWCLAILLFAGFLVCGRQERRLGKKDPGSIVIDEVCGMFLAAFCLMFVPYQAKFAILGFLLFRILDALKPYPAGQLQKIRGSLGVMGDDLIAALYTNIILLICFKIYGF